MRNMGNTDWSNKSKFVGNGPTFVEKTFKLCGTVNGQTSKISGKFKFSKIRKMWEMVNHPKLVKKILNL